MKQKKEKNMQKKDLEKKDLNAEQIRLDFPLLNKTINGKKIIYLDSTATTQKPTAVINAITNYYTSYNANIHRGIYKISEQATIAYELAHEKVAKFINCKKEEIIFTKNTTESINLLAYSFQNSTLLKQNNNNNNNKSNSNNDNNSDDNQFQLQKDDEIIITPMEHHSNLVPWQQLAKKFQLKLKYMQMDKKGQLIIDKKLFTNKTKIVAITHISNVLGTINDVKTIAKLAHEEKALVIIDAAQSVPHIPIDVQELNCDFLVFSGHKMLASTGIGCLYGKRELLEKMHPFLYGGDMIRTVDSNDATWNDLPWKFEAGTAPIAEGISLGFAIDYLQSIGMENIRKHEITLTEYALKELKKIKNIIIYGPENARQRGGVIAFNLKDIHPHDIATILDQDNICIRAGNHCTMPLHKSLGVAATVRASFYVYNTFDDIDQLISGLQKVKKIFRA